MHTYTESGNCFTVGHYVEVTNNNPEWIPESDWDNREDAAARVHYLNGGFNLSHFLNDLREALTTLKQKR